MTRDQWYALDPSAQKLWDELSNEAKAIILKKPPPAPNPSQACPTPGPRSALGARPPSHQRPLQPPRRRTNIHELDPLDEVVAYLHDLQDLRGGSYPDSNPPDQNRGTTSVHEANFEKPTTDDSARDDDNPVQINTSNRKPLPPGNLKRLLSKAMNNPPNIKTREVKEIEIDGVRYRECNFSQVTYRASVSKQVKQERKRTGTLVDCGANGGIAGENVQVIDTVPNSSVDVMGIDNHRVTDVPIVTAGAVVNTQKGEVIAIMHHCALLGKGKTIHSCGQLEHCKLTVDDKSRKVGGKQCITTIDGYVISLNVRNGLPHMSMQPHTDKEWNRLPKVFLTADIKWDPKVLDAEMEDDEEWFNSMSDPPTFTPDPLLTNLESVVIPLKCPTPSLSP